jgi:hypothetical protein
MSADAGSRRFLSILDILGEKLRRSVALAVHLHFELSLLTLKRHDHLTIVLAPGDGAQ